MIINNALPKFDGHVVYISNTPTPNQIELFNKVSQIIPVSAYFQSEGETSQNVSWKLKYPEWLGFLPEGKGLAKAAFVTGRHGDVLPSLMILGGYRGAGHVWLLLWARLKGVPAWVWMEAPEPNPQDAGLKGLVKRVVRDVMSRVVLPLATGVLAIDGRAETAYRRYHRRVERQPYAIDAASFMPKAKSPSKPLKCLFIGQMIDRKGIDELKGAFARISPADAQLSLAGGGPRKTEMEAFCAETGHKYLGFVQPADLPRVLSEQDVFVFPSRYDGWAVVVPQAMAAGLPVISNRCVGAFADLVDGKGCGKGCEQTADALYEAVMAYVNEPNRVEQEGARAREVFVDSRANAAVAAQALVALAE
jgi:glycosyltransferase involved in cell wall biosynthesis